MIGCTLGLFLSNTGATKSLQFKLRSFEDFTNNIHYTQAEKFKYATTKKAPSMQSRYNNQSLMQIMFKIMNYHNRATIVCYKKTKKKTISAISKSWI